MSHSQNTPEHLKISPLSSPLLRDASEKTPDFGSYSTKWRIPQKMAWRRNSGKLWSITHASMHLSPSGSCEDATITAGVFRCRFNTDVTHLFQSVWLNRIDSWCTDVWWRIYVTNPASATHCHEQPETLTGRLNNPPAWVSFVWPHNSETACRRIFRTVQIWKRSHFKSPQHLSHILRGVNKN